MAKAAVFVVFIVLAAWAAGGGVSSRRSRVNALLLYVLVISFGAGLSGREAWPFSHWPMDNGLIPRRFRFIAATTVSVGGHEMAIDSRAFEPLSWVDLTTWLAAREPIDSAAVEAIGPWLLATVRDARRRFAAGERPGSWSRRLGALAAPNTVLTTDPWAFGASVADTIVQLRFYEVPIDLDGPVVAVARQRRTLIFAYPTH